MRIVRPQVVTPEYVSFEQMFGPYVESTTTNLPSSGDQTPFFTPIISQTDAVLRGLLIGGGNGSGAGTANATPVDTATGRLKLTVLSANTDRSPGAVMKTAESFIIAGSGHVRDSTDKTLATLGSICSWFARCEFASGVELRAGTLYYVGGLWEGAFDATQPGQISANLRAPMGYQRLKATSAQNFTSFAGISNPATSIQFTADLLLRPAVTFWFKR